MSLSYWWSRSFLTSRPFLWLLFWCNLVGTVYGYIWYKGQLEYTLNYHPLWQIVFVPDSPTASLFFTISIAFLLYPPRFKSLKVIRQVMEALAIVTSVKYGIWASAIIFWGVAQGGHMVWQDWMLVASHTAMAVEALLFVRFFTCKWIALGLAAMWTLLNDTMDYTFGIYPYLPKTLTNDVPQVRAFTYMLTLFSIVAAWLAMLARNQKASSHRDTA
ncbi:DUF1405 domain-containing protein [Paenibacillus kribbensis]|uniref:DUF1405 domain-containing protein n=1 Tax=Paenibacillus kribbensis TaxID=172713 RepID=A0A222WLW3_9BACL|nr:DUF1405 domain-containing protein [Paenibacillus kribbensis]ASR47106.1 hypothetical protein B4V02_10615 [Paenibacillus kribbensis]MEC0237454.1 DUF1405 domain-containing protein [Paenibacillus kribbensis]